VSEVGIERWRRLTVKEGWRAFVEDEPTVRPKRMRLGEYRRLDECARERYDRERLRHAHAFGPIRSLYADIHRTLERLVASNEMRGPGARHGAALDGNPGNGKSTIASQFGRHHERRCRQRYPQELTPDGHEYLPVLYVNCDALPTIKGLNHAMLTFYGLGPPRHATTRELTQFQREVRILRSRYCPGCLCEQGTWLLRWQLAWSVACACHRTVLLHRCPECGEVPRIPLRESWPRDDQGQLRDPSRCFARPARRGRLCRASFRHATALPATHCHPRPKFAACPYR
jgi:hypothetical protein